ncbi:MAG: large subunit ribosomal protein [Patescibacteria group bacterium]|nr:large subunit ribosomal protein [Patescibacteria group bacterium]
MPKSKQQKQEILKSLNDKISRAKSIVFAGFDTLGVKDSEGLRLRLLAENSEYYVAKKTLIDRALVTNKISDLKTREFAGKVAAIFSYEDEVAAAKIIGDFRKDKEKVDKIVFLGGILDNKLLTQAEVEALANVPSKKELYAKLVGSLNAPVAGFVNVLAGNLRSLVGVLQAISEKK